MIKLISLHQSCCSCCSLCLIECRCDVSFRCYPMTSSTSKGCPGKEKQNGGRKVAGKTFQREIEKQTPCVNWHSQVTRIGNYRLLLHLHQDDEEINKLKTSSFLLIFEALMQILAKTIRKLKEIFFFKCIRCLKIYFRQNNLQPKQITFES